MSIAMMYSPGPPPFSPVPFAPSPNLGEGGGGNTGHIPVATSDESVRGEGDPHPLIVLIPLKPLARAKGRLAAALSPNGRRALVERLFAHVITAVRGASVPADIGVVAGDAEAAALARAQGVAVLAEADVWRVEVEGTAAADVGNDLTVGAVESRLNRALADALAWAEDRGYAAALILPADLPLLTAKDVDALWEQGMAGAPPRVVLAPDARDVGTNALLLRPPTCIAPLFGRESFHRHLYMAQAAGITTAIIRSPSLAHDVDTPTDLERLKGGG